MKQIVCDDCKKVISEEGAIDVCICISGEPVGFSINREIDLCWECYNKHLAKYTTLGEAV